MCGIAGIVARDPDGLLLENVRRMVDAQIHRGPDGRGEWTGRVGSARIALGHCRMAVLDLTDAGLQPMEAEAGRHVLVYNGELYNYRELRRELEAGGVRFRSQCDTEVVLHALARWGTDAFRRFNGMWALAWLDRVRGRLCLSRDRFGIKPLYVHVASGALTFASEIKSVLAGTGHRFDLNLAAVGRHLRQSLLDAQSGTFFEGIEAVPAGHWVSLDLHPAGPLRPAGCRYWSPPLQDAFAGGSAERIDAVRETFLDAVRLRLRSDVPVGVLLSGGVDSSAIAAAVRRHAGKEGGLHALAAVSGDPQFDESPHIDRMAAHLGCPVSKISLRELSADLFPLMESATWHNDEPIGSFENVAHFYLMRQARRLGLTVLLSGQGGDELLCGYLKYLGFHLESLVRSGRGIEALTQWAAFQRRRTVLPQFRWQEAKRYFPVLPLVSRVDLCGPRLREAPGRVSLGLGADGVVGRQRDDLTQLSIPALVHYEDRMSMAFAREIRLPFLDFRLVDLLLPFAPGWKLRHGWTKWVFRKAMEGLLPPEIVWRKDKQSFVLPQDDWLKGAVRCGAERILRGDLLCCDEGLVDRPALLRGLERYGRQPAGFGTVGFKDVFGVLSLEIWLRRFQAHLRAPAGGGAREGRTPEAMERADAVPARRPALTGRSPLPS